MDNKINLSQLADLLSQAGGMSKAASEQFVKNFFDIISQNVLADGMVKVKGLGTFKLIQMEDRESVNVNTGERFTIEGHQKISFTPDAELKERINKPFAAFDAVEITEQQAAELSSMEPDSSDEAGDNEDTATTQITNTMEKGKEVEPKKELKESKKENAQKSDSGKCKKAIIWTVVCVLVLALIIILLWPVIGGKALKKADKEIQKAPAPAVVKPEPKPAATTAAPKKEEAKFTLTKEDQAKALPLFGVGDTVNYKIVGTLTVHTMEKGDMLTTIALKYYGTKKLWPYIAKYNGLKSRSFKKMPVGYKVKVPKLANK